jgi:hypothetical protein
MKTIVDEIFASPCRTVAPCLIASLAARLIDRLGNYFLTNVRSVAFNALAARLKAEPTRLVICEQPRVFGSSSK